MRLTISQAISLILALPAHRSGNEGHRKIGDIALDLLIEYKEVEDKTDQAFNRAMIASVLSTVRAFSVERDRISQEWKAIEAIKRRRERYLDVIKNLSPLEKDNYWSKALVIVITAGLTFQMPLSNVDWQAGVWHLIIILVAMEIVSKILEVMLSSVFEKSLPIEKEAKWHEKSLTKYRSLVSKFIEEAIENHTRHYPNEKRLYDYDITVIEQVEKLKEYLLSSHFYY